MFRTFNTLAVLVSFALHAKILDAARKDDVEFGAVCRCSTTTYTCAEASVSQWFSLQWQSVHQDYCEDSFRDARTQLTKNLDSTMFSEGSALEAAMPQLKEAVGTMKKAMADAHLWSVRASLDGKSGSAEELIKGSIEKQLARAKAAIEKGNAYILEQKELSIATKELEDAIASPSISGLENAMEKANQKGVEFQLIMQAQRRQEQLKAQREKLLELNPKLDAGKTDLASVQSTIKRMADQMTEIDAIQNDLGPVVKEAMELDGAGLADNTLHEKLTSSGDMIRNPTEMLLGNIERGVQTALKKME